MEANNEVLSMSVLPTELIICILSQIKCPRQLCLCEEVCMKWRDSSQIGESSEHLWSGLWSSRVWRSEFCRGLIDFETWKQRYILRHLDEVDLTRRANAIVEVSMKQLALFQNAIRQQQMEQEVKLVARLEARRSQRLQRRGMES
uniref:F-box domain-containing protein n=1 Tax=Guillardia theta TaxID=55529 RepID=A0A6U6ABP6_GUITH|mmetsp:Transcript_31340/g.100534  ORF Transcript_31340/g.100534 Transcript_31340/m.100534 type:complete len:145 (+) Transcript_31340:88-522(+)